MWKRVIAPTIVVSVLWIACTSYTYYINRVYNLRARVLVEDVTTIRAAWAMQDALWRLHTLILELDYHDFQTTRIEISELENAFMWHLIEARETSVHARRETFSKAVRRYFAVYHDQVEARLQSLSTAGKLAMPPAEKEKMDRLARAVAEPCRQLVTINERMLADAMVQSDRISTLVQFLRFSFVTVGPIVGVVFGWWIACGLRRSISQISVTLSDAAGDLNHNVGSVKIQYLDDLPGLQQQVQIVAIRIRQVMEELQQVRRQAMLAERLAAVGELAAGIAHELRNPLLPSNC